MVLACALLSSTLLGLLSTGAPASARPNFDVSMSLPPAATTPVARGVASARGPGRDVPSLLWTPRTEPPPAGLSAEAAARRQFERHAQTYGVSRDALAGARTRFVHDTGRGGIIVVLRQTVAGVDVFHGDIKLLLDRSRRLLAISGSPHPGAHPDGAMRFVLDPVAAIATALRDLHGEAPQRAHLVEIEPRFGWRRYALASTGRLRFREPARVKPVYLPVGETLVPGHLVELQSSLGGRVEVFQYIVAADDGRLLMRRDATAHAHKYRVWAETGDQGRPLDGPLIDFNPHPAGEPTVKPQESTAPPLVTMDGFNTNPDGEADPWLADDATQTVGNNVDAYGDGNDSNSGVNQLRGTVTAPGVFDRVHDISVGALANDEQRMAALTQLFYVTNWMHDWWYDSGFDEAAGAAQDDNFGRGGEDGDRLLAEGQNGALVGLSDEANMATPLDGVSPRMQVGVYTGSGAPGGVKLLPDGDEFAASPAEFGPGAFDLTASLVALVDSGGASFTDGCEPVVGNVAGKIVLVDRGNCSFEAKSSRAQNAGAVGVVIADNVASNVPPGLGTDPMIVDPTIPTVGITQSDGQALRVSLQQGQQTIRIFGSPGVSPDASVDSMLIAHEWGHYLHHRLVECGSQACRAESEGWGDFNALLLTLREGDDLEEVYVVNYYSSSDKTGYFNHRRTAFSVDPDKNGLSFRHISDGVPLPMTPWFAPNNNPNSQFHSAGEIWTTMLWESYVALHADHAEDLDFDEVRRRMSDYVVAGMMLAPPDPTYTEQRDAILMAIAAANEEDIAPVAEAFARRGAGSCAVSPPKFSLDLVGVVEDFEVRGRGALLNASFGDTVSSCDQDGVLDVGEVGRLEIEVFNAGAGPLPAGATVEVVDPDPALVFPNGSSIGLPELAPLQAMTVGIEVELDAGLTEPKATTLRVRLNAPGGCEAPAERALPVELHADLQPASSTKDDVEAGAAWTVEGPVADQIWSRVAGSGGHAWHAANFSKRSDTFLVSPPFTTSQDQDLVISFEHAFSFQTDQGFGVDGGVIELSSDDGLTWHDISETIAGTGYNGTILGSSNPLVNRAAFVTTSEGYPALQPLSLDFGTTLAGQTMRMRLRIATGNYVSAPGWDIDNIGISGIVDTPFPAWGAEVDACVVGDTTGNNPTGGPEPDTGGSSGGESSGDGSGDDGSGGDGSGDGSDTAGPGGNAGEAGCDCDTDPRGPGWFAHAASLLLLLGLRSRRSPAC